ncbi:MAG: MarR family transcriptional regulator [Clostridia bacterium]|nr:MarR family transcriptional regulator [Clostridia bacterium]
MQDRFELFTVHIAKISRCIRKIKTEEMEEFELKSPHVSCLYYLYKQRSLTAKQLCDLCADDKAATSRSIEFLEKNGYVVCLSEQKKRYKSPFVLTEKGEKIAKKLTEKIDAVLSTVGASLTEAERALFYRCLLSISGDLEKYCEKYGD